MTACINAVDLFTGVRKGDYDQAVKAGRITVLGAAEDRAYLDKIESLAIHSGSREICCEIRWNSDCGTLASISFSAMPARAADKRSVCPG